MKNNKQTIYGVRIVPSQDENGLAFGGFEGIVISCSSLGLSTIEILKLTKKDEGYFSKAMPLSQQEVLDHVDTSGEAEAEFLISEAKKFAKENEEIAICDRLVPHFVLKDESWKQLQQLLEERN